MNEQWKELKETIIELRDNNGTATQQEVCKFLANQMDVLEKQISSSENPNKTGHWRHYENMLYCSECGEAYYDDIMEYCGDDVPKYCPMCGSRMMQEGEK